MVVVPKTISEADLKKRIDDQCKKPQCPSGKVLTKDGKKCEYPSLDKDDADKCREAGGRPYCARTPKDYCDYGECLIPQKEGKCVLTVWPQTRRRISAKMTGKIVSNVSSPGLEKPSRRSLKVSMLPPVTPSRRSGLTAFLDQCLI